MKNIRIFCLKNCHFLVVKFSVYLNRRVFVMTYSGELTDCFLPVAEIEFLLYITFGFLLNLTAYHAQ